MMEVRRNTAPLQETMQVLRHRQSVRIPGGGVRKTKSLNLTQLWPWFHKLV